MSTAEIGANLEKEETLKFFLAKNTASDLTTTISKPLPKVVASNSNSVCTGSKTELTAKAMTTTPKPKSNPARKKSKYAQRIEETETKREFFSSNVLKFGTEQESRAVFELIAIFVLLALKSLRESLEKDENILEQRQFAGRVIDTDHETFSLSDIQVKDGIDFEQMISFDPEKVAPTKFYVVRQLGYGANGVCCLARTDQGVPCVVKFFLRREENDHVERHREEAKMWNVIYKDCGFSVMYSFFPNRDFLMHAIH